jgi:hypothetical protein
MSYILEEEESHGNESPFENVQFAGQCSIKCHLGYRLINFEFEITISRTILKAYIDIEP